MEDTRNDAAVVALVESAIDKLDDAKVATETAKAVLRYVVGDLQPDEPARDALVPAVE